MLSYVQSLLANFVSAYYRITTWPPQKKIITFFSFPVPLGQICFVLVLISPNHKARNRYPEMDMARTVNLLKVAFGAVLFLKVFFNFSFRFVFIFVRNLFILVNLTVILHVFSLNLLLCVSCENKNSE